MQEGENRGRRWLKFYALTAPIGVAAVTALLAWLGPSGGENQSAAMGFLDSAADRAYLGTVTYALLAAIGEGGVRMVFWAWSEHKRAIQRFRDEGRAEAVQEYEPMLAQEREARLAEAQEREARLAAAQEREARLAEEAQEREARLAAAQERETRLAEEAKEREARLAEAQERETRLAEEAQEREARLAASREREAQLFADAMVKALDARLAAAAQERKDPLATAWERAKADGVDMDKYLNP